MLNYQDINIIKESKVGCQFENGFKYKTNNNSFNDNDRQGRALLILLLCSLIFLILYLVKDSKFSGNMLLFIVLVIVIYIYSKPIRILYSGSYLLNRTIRTPEFLNRKKNFPNHIYFEHPTNFQKILDETIHIFKKKEVLPLTKNTFSKENEYIGGGSIQNNNEDGWRLYLVQVGDSYPAANTMPFLVSILKQLKEVKSCAVSILPAKKIIPIHIGYNKGVMRYQLAIKVPQSGECFICVNGIKYQWTKGEGVLFDDTYPHKVYNDSEEDRIVLYMDVERPLNGGFKKMNNLLLNLVNKSSITKDEVASTEKLESLLKN